MRLIDRYILRQVIFGTVAAILVLSVILVMGNLFRQLRPLFVEQQAPLSMVLRFSLSVLPYSLMFTVPWGFLSAILLVFNRLSGDQEITALRSSGLSLVRLAAPVIALGGLLSLLCLYNNINLVPQARASMLDLLYEQVKRDPRSLLDPGAVQSQLQNSRLFVERRRGDMLEGFHLYQIDPDGGGLGNDVARAYVHARQAGLVVDQAKQQLRLRLIDTYIETRRSDGTVEIALAGEAEPWLFDFAGHNQRRARASTMSNSQIRSYLRSGPKLDAKHRTRFETEITKRHAFSMACLAFACVAVPLGLKARRRDSSLGLLVSLAIGGAFFVFVLSADQVRSTALATALLWTPHVGCLLLAWWLFKRAQYR